MFTELLGPPALAAAPVKAPNGAERTVKLRVIKNRPEGLRERFNTLADQLCISAVTLSEIIYGAEKSARQIENIKIVEQFAARLDVLPFGERAATHYGQIRANLEQSRPPYWAS